MTCWYVYTVTEVHTSNQHHSHQSIFGYIIYSKISVNFFYIFLKYITSIDNLKQNLRRIKTEFFNVEITARTNTMAGNCFCTCKERKTLNIEKKKSLKSQELSKEWNTEHTIITTLHTQKVFVVWLKCGFF